MTLKEYLESYDEPLAKRKDFASNRSPKTYSW